MLKSPPPPAGQALHGHLTLDPRGIDTFATIMHIVYAHNYAPSRIGDEAHHKAAREYVNAHHRVPVDCISADAASAVYLVGGGGGRPPTTVRIRLGRTPYDCVSLRMANDVWVDIDLHWAHVIAATPK